MSATTDILPRSKSPVITPRHDPLAEFAPVPSPAIDLRQGGRTFFAFVLVIAGIGMAGWLVYLLHAAVFHPHQLGFLLRIVSSDPNALVLTLPAGKVDLPSAGMILLAYFLLVVLTAVLAKVAIAFAKEGAWLLRHDGPAEGASKAGSTGKVPL